MKRLTGGGIQSSKLVRVGVRTGPPNTRIINPVGVAQLGAAQGGRMKGPESFTGINTAVPILQGTARRVRSGNAVAASTVAGPGGSRTIYKSGYQSLTPPARPMDGQKGRDILSEYGPDKWKP
jgi:hypothetical protein